MISIHYSGGNIFNSKAQLLVNPVNCVGISGAGLAKAYKERFPEMFKAYQKKCAEGALRPGYGYLWRNPDETSSTRAIYCFPTKDHWRNPSTYRYIEKGLEDLKAITKNGGYVSVAIIPLGCGLGRLEWPKVHSMIIETLAPLEISLSIYGEKP